MAPKSSQPLLLQIHKKEFLGSQVHFGIFGSKIQKKTFFGYSLTFHSGKCTKIMNFQKNCFLHFRCLRLMLKLQNFGNWQSFRVNQSQI